MSRVERGSRGPGKAAKGLTTDRIAAAAIAVADRAGPDRFTIKAVADELGVTPMALYHHVENKAELVGLCVDRAIRELPLPPPTDGGWKEGLLDLAHWNRRAMTAHPTIGQLQQRYRVWTPSALALGERWMGLWLQSGLSLEASIQGALMSSVAIIGLVHEESVMSAFVAPAEGDLALLPNLRAMYGGKYDPDRAFDLLVGSIIDGLYDRLLNESISVDE